MLNTNPPRRDVRGFTLVEQLWVLLVSGILLAVSVSGGARLLNATITRGAANDTADLLAMARDHAVATGTRTAVHFDAGAARVVVHAALDTLARLELARDRAVFLAATRDSMAYTAAGLGYGAANVRLIFTRGASADTVTVSRLGRVKRR